MCTTFPVCAFMISFVPSTTIASIAQVAGEIPTMLQSLGSNGPQAMQLGEEYLVVPETNDETYNFYRLRSMDDGRFTALLSVVDEDFLSSDALSGGSGIAPAFCIGESSLTDANSYHVTWDNTTYSGDTAFLADLNIHLDPTVATSVGDAYIKTTSTLEEYAPTYHVSSNNDLVVDLIAIDNDVPEKDVLSALEDDGYTFIKVGGVPLTADNYEINFYMEEESNGISDHRRCEIVIPAAKITGDIELTLFSYSVQ